MEKLLLFVVANTILITTKQKNMPTTSKTSLTFVSLQVRDLETSREFYANALGLELTQSPNPQAVVFASESGAVFALVARRQNLDEVKQPGLGVAIWLRVFDIQNYHDCISQRASIIRGSEETPFGKTFLVADPDGYVLTIQQMQQ